VSFLSGARRLSFLPKISLRSLVGPSLHSGLSVEGQASEVDMPPNPMFDIPCNSFLSRTLPCVLFAQAPSHAANLCGTEGVENAVSLMILV
jgi:hypothetical protein